ncbi:demethoxyubiquinone hydroxylase family protein [Asticcacaulis sp. AC402]|uniref:demethoxyubiquinone hydroxylase family protein n=1 Tax=Asticcacaulis sp. AC402 TaxID=1282361 RepID=UPI0003C3C2C5|nr:demethoxyubiquinone hydroxylase family protein [Asticcacaulis sp. AC402]ESQ75665.1 hypothetical protein ABAC402_09060 [Asticcacaulis sp. AC402]
MDMTTRTIARILKVNHAGEFGAIRIYRAQLWAARRWQPSLITFLTETLSHEIDHCGKFLKAMQERKARPCTAMWLWGIGGYVLGLATAAMGVNAVMACTKAVEQTVHRHLDAQIRYLSGRDEPLRDIILAIQVEENAHLSHAVAHLRPSLLNGPLEAVIVAATEAVIWLSTQGAVSRMEHELRRKT